jgi:DNA (cytosine-5)-methyltransferase 1
MKPLGLLDLFSGIGGFSLGLEASGAFEARAFVEQSRFCQRVLRKHWTEVPIYDRVEEVTAQRLRSDGIAIDAICGGFPCQDISLIGEGAGLSGEQSGLWREFARLVGELRPRFVIVENVAALTHRGMGDVLGALASLRYDAEWHCIPASYVGAPHERDRIWIVAYSDCAGLEGHAWNEAGEPEQGRHDEGSRGSTRAPRLSGGADPARWWASEPDVGRVAHGISNRVDRIEALGNSLVPLIPELIGRDVRAFLEGQRSD